MGYRVKCPLMSPFLTEADTRLFGRPHLEVSSFDQMPKGPDKEARIVSDRIASCDLPQF
jgi:hypothetical protein